MFLPWNFRSFGALSLIPPLTLPFPLFIQAKHRQRLLKLHIQIFLVLCLFCVAFCWSDERGEMLGWRSRCLYAPKQNLFRRIMARFSCLLLSGYNYDPLPGFMTSRDKRTQDIRREEWNVGRWFIQDSLNWLTIWLKEKHKMFVDRKKSCIKDNGIFED